MDVDDMDDNHVRNAFKMLLRNINKLKAEKQKAEKQQSLHKFTLKGDMAQEFNDTYFEDENDDRLEEIWEDVSFLQH